jgi:hypothetical protein
MLLPALTILQIKRTHSVLHSIEGFSPFILRLLIQEPRIRLTTMPCEFEPAHKFSFFMTANEIVMPHGLPHVAHEIAHAVEMRNSKRWLLPDWGTVLFAETGKRRPTNAGFFAALARECRVRAIQSHMHQPFRELYNHPSWGGEAKKRLHFGRFKCPKDIVDWLHDMHERTYRQWSLDRIAHEWQIRLDAMRHCMETSVKSRAA